MQRRCVFLILISVWLVACASSGPSPSGSVTPLGPLYAPQSTPAGLTPTLQPPTPTLGPFNLVILHTNDVMGEIDPCG